MPIALSSDPQRAIRAEGPWTHRDIPANGSRFHVVEAGSGPPVVLLHGFPMFWWTWRRQLVALASAGYRAIAMDLRGYGGSDHTPHGYDPRTMAADVAGVIRGLGESSATVVGHGWGGVVAWTMPVLEPESTDAIVTIGAPHPRAMRRAAFRWSQGRRLAGTLGLQLPFAPERTFSRDDGARVDTLLREWSVDPSWVDDASDTIRSAFMRWPTAHTALESSRWAFRSLLRSDGLGYFAAMDAPIDVDVLHLHGAGDPVVLPSSCAGSERYAIGRYDFALLPGGHFTQEESPAELTATLLPWLAR